MVRLIKKAVSVVLIIALLSGFAVVSNAAGGDVTLAVYKADGSGLGSDSVSVDDQITVRLSTKELSINSAAFHIWYNSLAFSYDNGSLSSNTSVFSLKSINEPASYDDISSDEEQLLNSGYKSVWITAADLEDVNISGEWASMTFTATNPVEAGQFIVVASQVLYTEGENDAAEMTLSGDTVAVTVVPRAVPATAVTLNKEALSLNINQTETLVATVDPENSTDSVVWNSSNDAIATVSNEGMVTGVSEGMATISVTAGSASATCLVTVSGNVAVTGVSLNKTELLVGVGANGTLKATVSPSNASDLSVTWSSSNPNVATVATTTTSGAVTNGRVTGVAEGTAIITATAGDFSASCTVTVHIPVTSVVLSGSGVKVGHKVQIIATVLPTNATNPSLTWTSNNSSVAIVDNNGVVTGVSTGTATITATSVSTSGQKGTFKVNVIEGTEGNYTVTMAEDISGISVGEQVLIPVSIGYKDDTVTSYNAYRMLISYDPAALEFISAASANSSSQFSADALNGVITVSDYGGTKNLGTTFTLKFTAIGSGGETAVTVTEAQVDTGENAITLDAPEAGLADFDTLIDVNVSYVVDLPEDYTTQQSLRVEPDGSFTFTIKDYDPNYDYTVTATMGGETVVVTDNGDGTYTISNITGDVIVAALVSAPKSFSVTFTPELEEVSGTATATYGTDYSFSIEEVSGFDYTVAITIGGVSYTTPEPTEGSYTIPGADITGAIVITITKTETPPVVETFSVTFDGAGATGAATATKGVDYTFIVAEPEDFAWKVEVTIGGAAYSEFIVNGNTYTIPSAAITGDIVIKTTMSNKIYNVTFIQTNGYPAASTFIRGSLRTSADEVKDTVERGSDYVFTLQMKSNYYYEMTVLMGGVEVSYSIDTPFDLDQQTPTRTFTIENVTGDLEIRLTRYMDLEVKIFDYVQLDGRTIHLVVASDRHAARAIYYNNIPTFRTSHYDSVANTGFDSYAYLIIDDGSFDQETFIHDFRLNSLNQWNGTGAPQRPETVSVNGDVNASGLVDINDAQLAYDIYNGEYGAFDVVTMLKFLQADVNADGKIDTHDAAAVIRKIA